jgi:hypothetical protein
MSTKKGTYGDRGASPASGNLYKKVPVCTLRPNKISSSGQPRAATVWAEITHLLQVINASSNHIRVGPSTSHIGHRPLGPNHLTAGLPFTGSLKLLRMTGEASENPSSNFRLLFLIIVGSYPHSLAVRESKWDAKRISETSYSVLQQRNKIR